MKKFKFWPYALALLVAIVLIAVTDTVIPYLIIGAVIVIGAVHAIKVLSGPGSTVSEQDKVEGHARAGNPMPPERSI